MQLEKIFSFSRGLAPGHAGTNSTENDPVGNPPSTTNGFPAQFAVEPLRIAGVVKETAQIGAAGALGIQLKTAADGLVGLREVPIDSLWDRADESLAYNAEQPAWKLVLVAERMAPRITADVFNLITIGDGLLGGSATIRFAILNQGVQEFRVTVPPRWRNVEFTGPNIRRKERQGEDTWVIGLQDKVWGGYTLVVTYDCQFDPHRATLPIGGIHPEGVERETGSVAITSAANLQLIAQPNGENIRRIDETELSDADRSLVTRPVLMAYKYQGAKYGLAVDVTRFEESPVLDAVADRTQLTTVLTEDGQMLTQASFMVKNNDRQFQTFALPSGAEFWACYVGGEAIKPEKNNGKLLVPLPRRANRDESFPVEIVYVQKIATLKSISPRALALTAPETDMQTSYAEWELYVPTTERLAGFGGNMIVARGATYSWHDAWQEFVRVYGELIDPSVVLFGIGIMSAIGLAVYLLVRLMKRFKVGRTIAAVVVIAAVLGIVAGLVLPTLSIVREASRANMLSNLKQMGLAVGTYADMYRGRVPVVTKGPSSSERAPTLPEPSTTPPTAAQADAGLAGMPRILTNVMQGAPHKINGGNVVFNDGHVEWKVPLPSTPGTNGNAFVLLPDGFDRRLRARRERKVLFGEVPVVDLFRATWGRCGVRFG